MRRPTTTMLLPALALALALGARARAETLVLDAGTGADYDAVGDGWFFAGATPPLPPPDGVGDAGGQALAIGLIAGVLELRAMAEFPLAPLAGLSPSQIQSATVRFAIDDVIGTFGPGASFDGTASDPIAVYHYPADGTVTVADFSPAGLVPLGVVMPGVVTDATLLASGALPFQVDATQALKDALAAGTPAFGVLFGTTDAPTATSLDGLSPPGVAGGHLPFLAIETVALEPPVFGKAEQACQGAIAKEGATLLGAATKAFAACFQAILKDWQPDAALGAATTQKCTALLDPAAPGATVAKALARFTAKIDGKCGGLSPTAVGSPCDASAATFAQTIACLRARHLSLAQAAAASQYASACTLLSAVGLEGGYPEICAP